MSDNDGSANVRDLAKERIEVMLSEHSLVREEILERLKIAFSHLAYAGGIAAFAFPVAEKVSGSTQGNATAPLALALTGFVCLLLVALYNLKWIVDANFYLMSIEKTVDLYYADHVLGWEHFAQEVRWKLWPTRSSTKVKLLEEAMRNSVKHPRAESSDSGMVLPRK